FASMNEERLDKMQGNIDANDKAIGALTDQVDSFASMNEERLDKMQGNIDANDKAIGALTDQVDSFASMNEERLDKMQGNIDANDKAIGALTDQVDSFASMNEERLDKMQKQVDTLDADVVPEIEGLVKENEEIKSTLNSFGADIAQISGLAEKVEQLESSVQMIADPTDPDSLINGMSERMAAMEEEFNAKITELMKTIAELEDEIKALKGE
ncbi:MAG: hypothetical protein K2L22_02660, partial [Muribaculaceae bacterium]|nr:hypothetical protein [Muribaculaceae bacterium]